MSADNLMYQSSVPVFLRYLNNLAAILRKAEKNAADRKIDLAVFVNARLAPDMYPLAKQIQLVSDNAKGPAARLAGMDVPSMPDTEVTFAELQQRVAKTIAFLETIPAAAMAGAETRDIELKMPSRTLQFKGADYLTMFALPNFYFHLTTAYAILRHNGVDIGKRDYLGPG